jgi:hypothetical protein
MGRSPRNGPGAFPVGNTEGSCYTVRIVRFPTGIWPTAPLGGRCAVTLIDAARDYLTEGGLL